MEVPARARRDFQRSLLRWFSRNRRDFPWRETRDPFHILISEICLQKTGALKAEPVYNYIGETYPTPSHLQNASLTELENLFEPLGLVSRAELLIKLAGDIEQRFSGKVPLSYEKLVSLKGVGQYIANSILVFAHGQTQPLVDEGIARVYRRVFGLDGSKRAYADNELWEFARDILPHREIREFHWALIDLSAMVCKPKNPDCEVCPLQELCSFAQHRFRETQQLV